MPKALIVDVCAKVPERGRQGRSPPVKKRIMAADAEQLLSETDWPSLIFHVLGTTYAVDSGDIDSLTTLSMPTAAEYLPSCKPLSFLGLSSWAAVKVIDGHDWAKNNPYLRLSSTGRR